MFHKTLALGDLILRLLGRLETGRAKIIIASAAPEDVRTCLGFTIARVALLDRFQFNVAKRMTCWALHHDDNTNRCARANRAWTQSAKRTSARASKHLST